MASKWGSSDAWKKAVADYESSGRVSVGNQSEGWGSSSTWQAAADAYNSLGKDGFKGVINQIKKDNQRYSTVVNSVNKFFEDAYNFENSVREDNSDDRYFNAAEYFEERKRQADSLKQRLPSISQQLESGMDYYEPTSYDSMINYLSNFDTMVDEALSTYQPALESRAGMRAYEDEMISAMERNAQIREATQENNKRAMFGIDPMYQTMGIFDYTMRDPDYSYRGIDDSWTAEQRFNLGSLQNENPEEAKRYAQEVNQYNANSALYAQQERQKQEMEALDLNAAKEEIDALRAELDNFYATHDYTADAEYRQKQKELTQKETLYNQAERQQEAEAFRSVTANDDFAAKSGYVSTEAQNFRDWMFSEYGMGYNDLTYEYINDPEKIGELNDEFNRRMLESNYELMQNDEIAIYNYLYATEGKKKAEDYLNSLQDTLSRRRSDQTYSAIEGKTARELLFGVNAGVNQFMTSTKSLLSNDDYIPVSATQLTSQRVRDDLQNRAAAQKGETGFGGIAPVAYDVISTTANMLPSMAVGALANAVLPGSGGYVGSALMGASAAGGAYQEAINSGYSKEQARVYSTMVGLAETGMEKVLGIVGGGMPDAIKKKAIDAVDGAIAKFAIEKGFDMVSEGIEEGLQEVISPWMENVFLMADKEVNLEEVAYSALLGALSTLPFTAAEGVTTALTRGSMRNTPSHATVEAKTFQTPVETPKVSTEGKAMQISTKNDLDVKDFASMSDNVATIMTNDGDVVDYDDVSWADQKQANQFYAVRSLPGLDTEAANDLLTAIQDADAGQDTDSVVGIRDAYRIGYFNQDVKGLETGDASVLSPELRQAVYDIGVRQNQAEAAVKATVTPVTTKPSKGYQRVTLEGNIKLNSNQKAQVDFIDKFSDKVSKTSVHVFESYVKNGKRYYKDSSGKEVLAPNGKYVNGEIWVDLKSGDKGEGLILNTFAHEMYHHIESQNKAGANKLASWVSKNMGIKNVDAAVEAQIRKARAAGYGEKYFRDKGMSAEQARNEVYARAMSDFVADSLETMFTRGDPADAIAQLYKEDRTLFDQIKEFIDKFISKVKQFYSDKTISAEGAAVAQLDNFQELQRMFMEAAKGAGENLGNEDTVFAEDTKNPGEQYSIRGDIVDSNGREYDRVVELEYNVFNKIKRSGKAYIDFIRNNLINKKITVYDDNGDLEVIEFAGEKERVQKDGAKNSHPVIGEITRAKNETKKLVIVNAKETAEISRISNTSNENSHQWLDKNGWEERTSHVMTKDGTVYPVILHIAKTRDGRNILYDVNVKINEGVATDKIATSQRAKMQTEQAVRVTKPSYETVSHPDFTVNTEMNSLRNEKPLTNRQILEQLDIAKRKPWERDHLQRYQERSNLLREEKPKLESVNARIKELSADPKQNKAELTQLKAEARALKRSVDSLSRKIREQEQSEMFKRIATEERLRLQKETGKKAQKSYKDEQREMVKDMNMDQRMIREMLTGTQSLMSRMEDNFIDLVKAYENKEIDRKTMRTMFVQLGQEYDQQTKDAKIWDREFSRLMKMYDELSAKYTKDTGAAKKKIERLEETILRQRATAKARVEGRRNTEMRHKIQKKVNELNKILLHGTKHRNVPEGMQAAVAAVLDAINMETKDIIQRVDAYEATLKRYSERIARATNPAEVERLIEQRNKYAAKGDQFGNKMAELKAAYEQIQKDKIPEMEMDAGIYEHLMTLFVIVGDTPLGQMNAEQMNAVNDVLNITMATIRNANKMFQEAQHSGVEENSKLAMREIRSVGGGAKKRTEAMENIEKFGWNNLKPVQAFETIGSSVLNRLFKNLRSGEDTLARDLEDGKYFFRNQWQKYNGENWDTEKKWKFTSTSGKAFELDLNQIMSLYALAKRDQARDHLRVGGFTFDSQYKVKDEIKVGPVKINAEVKNTDASAYNLSDEILGEIIGTLTTEQRAFVDAMQEYLSDNMASKGNDISLKKYGIRLFKDKNYFPLRVADQYMAKVREQQTGDRKLKNSGFTQAVVPNAKNPVVLSSFLEVWAEHVDEMSLYHSFVLPLDDLSRVLNYHDAYTEETAARSVVEAIKTAYGEAATQYIDKLIRDVNGGSRTDSVANTVNNMLSKVKKAQTMASLSVAIQQPSAVLRSMAMIDSRYFIGAKVTEKSQKRTWDEIKEHAPIAIIKEMGGFDTNVGQTTVDYLTDTSNYEGIEKVTAFFKDKKYRDEVFGMLPAKMDELAWGMIWNAAKREIKDQHPNMDVNGNAFWKLVADRFTDVIVHTQVYDSVFSRSGMMRSKDTGVKMVTSFMAEPTTTANMLAMAIIQAKRGDISNRQVGRVVGSIAASIALNSFLVSFVYAMRDDDEDERLDEKWIRNFWDNVWEGINPLNYIPIARDAWSIMQGFDVDRADMSLFDDLRNAINGLKDEDISPWEKTEAVLGAVGNILGVPMKNILRDSSAIYKTFKLIGKDPKTKTSTGRYMARRGMDLSDKEQMILAVRKGDEEHLQRVFGRYETQEDAESALQSAIREKYVAGEMEAQEAQELLDTYFDRDDEHDIYWILDQWDYAKEHGNTYGYAKMGALLDAVESGDYEAEIQRYLDHGSEMSEIQSAITKKYKKQYLEADEAGREAIQDQMLKVYQDTGMYEKDVLKKFNDWDFEAEYGYTYAEYKAAYRDGEITEQDLRGAMKFYGLKNFEIDRDIREINDDIKFREKFDMSLSQMKDAYDNGDVTKRTLENALVYTGMTKKEAQQWISQRDISNQYGIEYMYLDDAYKSGDITRTDLYNAIVKNGATKQEADEAIAAYDWLKQNYKKYPDLAVGDAKKFVVRLSSDQPDYTLADFGVKIDDYIEYSKLKPECKGVDNNGDGKADDGTKRDAIFRMIDSLPISSEAKDGLALIDYGIKSIRKNAPWH